MAAREEKRNRRQILKQNDKHEAKSSSDKLSTAHLVDTDSYQNRQYLSKNKLTQNNVQKINRLAKSKKNAQKEHDRSIEILKKSLEDMWTNLVSATSNALGNTVQTDNEHVMRSSKFSPIENAHQNNISAFNFEEDLYESRLEQKSPAPKSNFNTIVDSANNISLLEAQNMLSAIESDFSETDKIDVTM